MSDRTFVCCMIVPLSFLEVAFLFFVAVDCFGDVLFVAVDCFGDVLFEICTKLPRLRVFASVESFIFLSLSKEHCVNND